MRSVIGEVDVIRAPYFVIILVKHSKYYVSFVLSAENGLQRGCCSCYCVPASTSTSSQ